MAISEARSAAPGTEAFWARGWCDFLIRGEKPEVVSPYLGKSWGAYTNNARRRGIGVRIIKAQDRLPDSKSRGLTHIGSEGA